MLLVDDRWSGKSRIGIGRFSREVLSRIPEAKFLRSKVPLLHPSEPLWLSWRIHRLHPAAYFSPGFNPPLICKSNLIFMIFDLVHVTGERACAAWKRAYYEAVVRPACKKAFRVLTSSYFSKMEIQKWAGLREEQVTVVGAGVDDHFRPGVCPYRPGYPYLLYLGNRRPHKNIPRLLRAFSKSCACAELTLLMSGNADASTSELVRQFEIEHRVRFLGDVPEDNLPGIISGAMALLMPSLCEGFGLPALEAMACGTPVICSSAASLPEVVGEAALQVDPYSEESIAAAIDRIWSDPELRSVLRVKGITQATRFSWDATASSIRKVLYEAGGLSQP